MAFIMHARNPVAASAPARRAAAAVAPRMAVRAQFKVTVRTPSCGDVTFECPADKLILDAAEEAGVELPFLCRTGTCVGCAGRRVEGLLEQPGQAMLGPDDEAKGFALLCQSYPRSDLVILSHQEQSFYCSSQFEEAASAKTSSR